MSNDLKRKIHAVVVDVDIWTVLPDCDVQEC